MSKPRVYIETTVPNYVFDEDYPERQAIARKVFELIRKERIEGFISQTTAAELSAAKEPKKSQLKKLVKGIKVLPVTKKVNSLAKRYIKEGIFPKNKLADATHVAVASVNEIEYLFSWNFRHIVRVRTKEKVAAVNMLLGYKIPQIVTPEEVAYDL